MNWKGRKPTIKYVEHGCVEYFKDINDNELKFMVIQWSKDGIRWIKHQPYGVPSNEFVNDILGCTTLEDVKNICDTHLNVKVIQK